jgi:hypothetical protein
VSAWISVRFVDRYIFFLFILIFVSPSLSILFPQNSLTLWIKKNRRYLGISFGIGHLIAFAIACIFLRDQMTNSGGFLLSAIVGGIGSLLVTMMLLTSNNFSISFIGMRRWKVLHKIGVHYIALLFFVQFFALSFKSSIYLIPLFFLLAAITTRLAIHLKR